MTAQLALTISFLSFCISTFTFYRGSTRAQNERIKAEKMRVVAARSVLIWDQMKTVMFAKRHGHQIDPYFFSSYQRNIRRLEDSLDGAVSVGLFGDLVGNQENALTLHNAFVQSLAHMETLDPEKAELDDWIKQHFLMGMVRLIDCCVRLHSYTLPKNLRVRLVQNLSGLKDEAWTYIQDLG